MWCTLSLSTLFIGYFKCTYECMYVVILRFVHTYHNFLLLLPMCVMNDSYWKQDDIVSYYAAVRMLCTCTYVV